MSASAAANTPPTNSMPEVDDMNMFQAARRGGRRNALGDFGEQFSQGTPSLAVRSPLSHRFLLFAIVNAALTASELDKLSPHFQSMSIKH